jgi:hypothetical protein
MTPMMKLRATLVASALLAACSRRVPEQVATAAPPHAEPQVKRGAPPTPVNDPELPLLLAVNGPSSVRAGDVIDVAVRIDRQMGEGPIEITIAVPTGATLVSGQLREIIPPKAPSPITRTFRMRLGAIPATDFQIEVDAPGEASGAHAKGAYRFGRAEPKLPDPGMMQPDP